MKIEHMVLAVAGLGKRLYPLTKDRPKALVPVNGTPLIHYALEEARGTDIRHVTLVVSPVYATQFRDYVKEVEGDFPEFTFHIVQQRKPLGNGHAVLQAASVVKNNPFAVRFPDDLLFGVTKPILHSMIALYETIEAPVVLLEKVPKAEVSKYGVVAVRSARKAEGGILYRITGAVEKPPVEEAPSDLTIVGSFIITPAIMGHLQKLSKVLPHFGNDVLPLVSAFEGHIGKGDLLYGWELAGMRLDCGSVAGFKEAEKFLIKRARAN